MKTYTFHVELATTGELRVPGSQEVCDVLFKLFTDTSEGQVPPLIYISQPNLRVNKEKTP